ncbi:hypothetical protein AcW1_000257 [Taiwanofungus camphoratus]|nr:hypothetical protein AcW2_001246 [Antrodia cinnamomea]KAI0935855.1 hypothetical protein AcV5_004158 [Antrodia cinnamomea]KAI0961082.1 hypothetical protein AcV7_000278 [Antrodia cinnamomea]KAI0963072.1 hypothetical protein AcW1_000257 [Antrodia cinnamomea]
MRVLVLGGTGPAGILIIQEALHASHTVIVYARSPQKLPESISLNPSATIIKGELTETDKLSEALEGVDAVLSALGPQRSHPAGNPIAHAYASIIDLLKKRDIKRLILVATPSAKDEHDRFSLNFSIIVGGIKLFVHNAYSDIVAIGETIRAQGGDLEWTLVRVPLLNNKPTKDVIAGYVGDGKTKTTLARAGFAAFVVGELEKNEWVKKAPLISSP